MGERRLSKVVRTATLLYYCSLQLGGGSSLVNVVYGGGAAVAGLFINYGQLHLKKAS